MITEGRTSYTNLGEDGGLRREGACKDIANHVVETEAAFGYIDQHKEHVEDGGTVDYPDSIRLNPTLFCELSMQTDNESISPHPKP